MFGKRSTGDDPAQKVVLRPQAGPAVQPGQPQAAHAAPNPAALVEGGRAPIPSAGLGAPLVSAPAPASRNGGGMLNEPAPPLAPTATDSRHSEIYYETKGSGFPLLLLPPGGMNATIDWWGQSAFNPLEIFSRPFWLSCTITGVPNAWHSDAICAKNDRASGRYADGRSVPDCGCTWVCPTITRPRSSP